jgi:hypothetical protein
MKAATHIPLASLCSLLIVAGLKHPLFQIPKDIPFPVIPHKQRSPFQL